MTDPLVDWPKNRLMGVITLGRRYGIGEERLLTGTGLTLADVSTSPQAHPVTVEFTAIRNLQRLVSPDVPLGLYAGLDFHLRTSCYWGEALSSSDRFGGAVAVASEYVDLSFSLVRIEVATEGDSFVVRFRGEYLPADVRMFLTMRSMFASEVIARELLGRSLPLRAVTAAFPRPSYARHLDERVGVPITWDADETAVHADASWLAAPLPAADPAVHEVATRNCHLLMQRHLMREGLSAKVREYLAAAGTASATPKSVAEVLDISARTLRRRLQAEGTSFRQLLDEARMTLAGELFVLGLSVEETSTLVGYSQQSAFAHAFKRWTGTSPDAWRRSLVNS